jgi:hypothetical protein
MSTDSFHGRLIGKLTSYYEQQMMCDVTLTAGDYSVKAHRAVLAARSDYFEAMFSGDWAETKASDIVLHGLTPCGLKAVLEFCYKGDIGVKNADRDTISEVLMALAHCQLIDACTMYGESLSNLLVHLEIGDLIWMYDLSDLLGMEELAEAIVELLAETVVPNVGESRASVNPLVYELGKSLFGLILDKWDYLKAGYGKIAVCDLIVKWADHDFKERENHLADLMMKIVSPEQDVVDIVNYCRLPLSEKMQLINSDTSMKENGLTIASNNRCSLGLRWFMLGYHYASETWKQLPMIVKNYIGEYAVLENMLYVLYGDEDAHTECYRYNPYLDLWEDIRPLPNPRQSCPMVACQGKLYLVGGQNEYDETVDSVDIYDPTTNSWSLGVPLPQQVDGHGIVEHNGAIYVSGGLGQSHQYLRQFLRFVPGDNSWTELKPMLQENAFHEIVVHKDKLYTLFGQDEDSVSCYDINTDTWQRLEEFFFLEDYNIIYRIGACSVDESLYAWSAGSLANLPLNSHDSAANTRSRWHFTMLRLDIENKTSEVCYEINNYAGTLSDSNSNGLVNLKVPSIVLRNLPDMPECKLTNG